jgi:hypothetical protein
MFVEWKRLTAAQKLEVVRLRPRWHMSDFKDFVFWVKPDGHLSRRGGHQQMTKDGYNRKMARYAGVPRSKGDLAEWKPGVIFHFNREPV